VDAQQALADLMEISSQVDAAVVVGADGSPLASSLPAERGERLARAAARLLDETAESERRRPVQVEAATRGGSVFVVREDGHTIAATTGPSPTAGLVLYDLRTCLRALAEEEPAAPKPTRRRKKAEEAGGDEAA
jgi:predicted regulator of Ras-like GTPase activity (Roadblock/LC7/MglB family)